jgi:hypothetical protein
VQILTKYVYIKYKICSVYIGIISDLSKPHTSSPHPPSSSLDVLILALYILAYKVHAHNITEHTYDGCLWTMMILYLHGHICTHINVCMDIHIHIWVSVSATSSPYVYQQHVHVHTYVYVPCKNNGTASKSDVRWVRDAMILLSPGRMIARSYKNALKTVKDRVF